MLARTFAVVCWLGLLLLPVVGQDMPDEHVVDRAVLVDTAGSLTIAEAERADYARLGAVMSAGYTDAVHWLRVVVRAPADGGELILRVRPTYLDEVTLYSPDPEAAGGWSRAVSGDRLPFLERSVPGVPLAFEITPSEPQSTYFLRLRTTSSSLLHVSAMTPQAAYVNELWIGIVHLIGFSMMAGILIWAGSEMIVARDAVLGWFTLAQTLQLIYFVAITGNLAPIVASIGPVDELTSLLVCLVPLTTLIFHRVLIRPFAPARLALGCLDGLVLVCIIVLMVLLVGWTRLALQVNAVVVLLSAPMFLCLAWTARSEGPTGRLPLRVVYTLQSLALFATMIPLLGLAGGVEWVMHGTLLPGLLSAALMFILLHRRSRTMKQHSFEAQLNLGLARQQLALERGQREVQGQFLAMLTHELKTPITVARLALGTARTEGEPRRLIEAALENMNAIVDRCAYADQMEQNGLTIVNATCDVAAVIAEAIASARQPERIVSEVSDLPPVVTDRLLLGVIVANLLDNALKYGAKDTPVRLDAELREHGGRRGLCIGVENRQGRAGMPDPDRVFSKFYRAAGAGSSSGAGLGLYIVNGMTERLGGAVSYVPKGDTVRFELWLPC